MSQTLRASAWLTIELRDQNNWSGRIVPVISGARQTRPTNKMAVKVTLEFLPEDLQPHIDRLIDAGHISLVVEDAPEDEEAVA